MRVYVSLLLFIGVLTVFPAFGQSKVVTNADLEKYRQKRLQDEKDYSENYTKMGFPSPQELQNHFEKSKTERDALSARLANERLERERIEAELASQQPDTPPVTIVNGSTEYRDRWVYPNNYPWYQPFYRPYRGYRRFPAQPGVGNGIPMMDYGYPRR